MEEIKALCGESGALHLMLAIKQGVPIMIYDRHATGADAILYRALKALGAKVVRNYDMTLERDGAVVGVYCTVFIHGHSNTRSSFAKAGEESETLKQ